MFCHMAYLNYFYTFSLEGCNYCHLGTGIIIWHSVRCHLSFLLCLLTNISHLYIYWKKILSSCKDSYMYSLIRKKYALIAFSKKKILGQKWYCSCIFVKIHNCLKFCGLFSLQIYFYFYLNKRGRIFQY